MATKHKKADGSWIIQFKDADGKWKQKRCGKNATAADAETIRKLYDAQELNRRHAATVRVIGADLLTTFIEFRDNVLPQPVAGRARADDTIRRYTTSANNVIDYFKIAGIKKFSDLDKEAIEKLFNYMTAEKKRSPSTLELQRQVLIDFFEWAIKIGYATTNHARATTPPKRIKKLPRYFSEEELKKIFETANEPYKTIFKFLYLTGLRIGELGNLQWIDYNAQQEHIILRVMDGNKTKREEIVPLNEDAINILERLKKEPPRKYIFVCADGSKMKNSRIYTAWLSVAKKTGIANASPHTFRHTCASHLAIKGVSLYIIKEILRHASIKETEIYAHLSKEAVSSAIKKLRIK